MTAGLIFHTQQQSLCHLASRKMKKTTLKENAVLPHTETKKPAYTFVIN